MSWCAGTRGLHLIAHRQSSVSGACLAARDTSRARRDPADTRSCYLDAPGTGIGCAGKSAVSAGVGRCLRRVPPLGGSWVLAGQVAPPVASRPDLCIDARRRLRQASRAPRHRTDLGDGLGGHGYDAIGRTDADGTGWPIRELATPGLPGGTGDGVAVVLAADGHQPERPAITARIKATMVSRIPARAPPGEALASPVAAATG
jgi:hypothetical protein